MKRYPERSCLICGDFFTPIASTNTLCSLECRLERRRRMAKDWYKKPDNRDAHIRKVSEAKRRRQR